MPPKKNKKNISKSGKVDGEIVNMYERIPKRFLESVDNPNFHIHKLKIPMRCVLCAPSGSGKTNFLMCLLNMFSAGKGTFQSITIITRNQEEPLYCWLKTLSDQIVIKEGINNTPPLDKFDKDFNHLVVWDDLVLSKNLSMVEQYYIRARKLNVSCIFISQSFFRIPKIIRNNCNYMIILKLSGQREVNLILSEFGLGVSKEELVDIYQYATREKFSPLVIDMEAEPQERFRKGMNEIITIHQSENS